MEQTISEMKEWCLRHYEVGADTMVECWGDEDYANIITAAPSVEQAWSVLKSITSVYFERQCDARHYREVW